MKKLAISIIFILGSFNIFCQEEKPAKKRKFGSNVFLPSLEVGYLGNNSSLVSGGILIKTSLEYRLGNNNDFFLRLNYDTHDGNYDITQLGFTNVIEGKARFSDFIGGLGYRFGDKDLRVFLLAQAGIKTYNFPFLEANNNTLLVGERADNIFTTRATLGLEYYFDKKSAISVELIQGNVWDNKDFWINDTGSWGFSIGFITSLF